MKQPVRPFNILIIVLFCFSLLGPAATSGGSARPNVHPLLQQLAADNPRQLVSVIVQKTTLDNRVEAAVTRLGGQVTKDLRFIRAFAAQMSARSAVALGSNPGVRWVSPDARMERSTISNFTVRDEFTYPNFSNNNGTVAWATSWTEIGETDGPSAGRLRVASNRFNCYGYYCLFISGNNVPITDKGLWRGADLSNVGSATLTFNMRRLVSGQGGSLSVQVSGDGGTTWQTLATYALNTGDFFMVPQSFTITAFASSQTRVRFIGSGNVDGTVYIDNIEIAYNAASTPNYFLATTGADRLHTQGFSGQGIGVAVVDSGINHGDLNSRVVAVPLGSVDDYGHGTHVAGIIGGNGAAAQGFYRGMAPGVNLVNLDIADATGMAYESSVVGALQWIYDNRAQYNIRVVNLSLNSTLEDSYHNSPLDAAVEILWFNNMVVVASAGNKGPVGGHNTTKTAPANDPFIITVGASDEHGTAQVGDDTVAPFSSFGVTLDGFNKPDIIAPGYNIVAALSPNSPWAVSHPERVVEGQYIRLSGTSMAAPTVTGAVALLLQDEPNLTADQVKYRLTHTGRMIAGDGVSYPYLDTYTALYGTSTDSANFGQTACQLLWTGSNPITWGSVAWNSVAWNSVAWNSVAWNSVAWNSVAWNSVVQLDGIFWGRGNSDK